MANEFSFFSCQVLVVFVLWSALLDILGPSTTVDKIDEISRPLLLLLMLSVYILSLRPDLLIFYHPQQISSHDPLSWLVLVFLMLWLPCFP